MSVIGGIVLQNLSIMRARGARWFFGCFLRPSLEAAVLSPLDGTPTPDKRLRMAVRNGRGA